MRSSCLLRHQLYLLGPHTGRIRLVLLISKRSKSSRASMELNSICSVTVVFYPFIVNSNLTIVSLDYLSWTHVIEIANTGFLVSVHHCSGISANLEVFDVSRKGQAKKIYSFEEVGGCRIILGAIPVGRKTACRLYNFATSNAGNIVKFIRKSKWQPQYSTKPSIQSAFQLKIY